MKRYKDVEALAGLDLSVQEGQVLALLGPNGAGKATAVRGLTTLLRPDEGSATAAGIDLLAGHAVYDLVYAADQHLPRGSADGCPRPTRCRRRDLAR